MITQKQLYQYNQQRINDTVNHNRLFLDFEREWIDGALEPLDAGEKTSKLGDLLKQLDQFISDESSMESASADYVGQHMPREEFKVMLQEFSIDGLTEAQVFYYIMPRLHLQAQMPMLRILIDEFGSANPNKMHTTLFISLLEELEMPVSKDYYLDRIDSVSYEFVNLYYWLTLRADDPSYFVGALTYLETIIPVVFRCLVDACDRLGINAHHYYSEHCHIDEFHSLECKKILRAMAKTNTLNPHKAWLGMQLSSLITNRMFDNSVAIAQAANTQSIAISQRRENANG
jgi:hypothetical protein